MPTIDSDLAALLLAGCGRGSTVLCAIGDAALLGGLAATVGPTGLVLAVGLHPLAGATWAAVRCQLSVAAPLRSHIVDAVLVAAASVAAGFAEEARRVLAPGGDLRVWLPEDGQGERGRIETALGEARIGAQRWVAERGAAVLIARGP